MSSDPAHVLPAEPPPSSGLQNASPAEAPTTAPTVAPHARRMLDRYEIIAEIAKGGMGTVYLARLEGAGGFERLMAIKLMHEHLAEEEQFVTMLLDEARTAASIHHPNAVGIVDICESPVGYYLVMNYVDGFSLWQVMTHPALDDRTRIRLSTRLIADALHGLHAAHTAKNAKGERLGIVHRDVSPQNVLVGSDGMGRIVDFGIALAASRIAASRPGVLKGKPSYMAPEQARGDACDGRTDVFAMGIVLWEALVNERLFWAEMDVAILMQVMDCIVERPDARRPELPAALADVVMKALARSPADRYATARDFAVALEKAADAAGLLATTHEVEDKLGEIFADEMAEKQRAIGGHLSASSGAPTLLQKGQLGTIPRLIMKKPASRDLATRGGAASAGSGVRSRGDSLAGRADVALARTSAATPVAHAQRAIVTPPSGAILASSEPPVAAPAPDSRAGKLGLVLGAVGLLLVLAALGLYFSSAHSGTPAQTTTEGSPQPPTTTEPVIAPPPTPPTTTTVVSGVLPPPDLAPPGTTEPAVSAPAAPTQPAATEAARPTTRRAGASTTTTMATPATPAHETPAHDTTMRGSSPELESNPYLTH